MKIMVSENLYVADMEGCSRVGSEAIIHACKNPCYVCASDEGKFCNILESDDDLYLNMIDPSIPLFKDNLFNVSIEFIRKNIEQREVVIHCNQGKSRSASIAMLYLFGKESYRDAQDLIKQVYPYYQPSLGIDLYLEKNWKRFL